VIVTKGERIIPQTTFLPGVCNLPIGMHWPVTIGFPDFIRNIQGAYGFLASSIFHLVLSALEPTLSLWCEVIAVDPSSFVMLGCPFLPIYDTDYLDIDAGECPRTILDNKGFSPLLDMLHGYAHMETMVQPYFNN
jgi:hypothetical protein